MRAEKALKMSKRKDGYKILGISKAASVADIKRALQWHPNKNADNREEAGRSLLRMRYSVMKTRVQDMMGDVEDMRIGNCHI
ncbi:hypothetical protein SAY87_001226 [Trapa incisa]|uniref:J domain-containing protein n=1 Tax=Trapa incisa TaxID=236973 RepID=A0AAN7GCW3_9MYRT|nr:hypothetical protein SAY87_001226 [Trapa incisa]